MTSTELTAYLDAYARQHPDYAAWRAKHWVGDVDGHTCPACNCLTANNGVRRLCLVCRAVYPLVATWQQPALFGEGAP